MLSVHTLPVDHFTMLYIVNVYFLIVWNDFLGFRRWFLKGIGCNVMTARAEKHYTMSVYEYNVNFTSYASLHSQQSMLSILIM